MNTEEAYTAYVLALGATPSRVLKLCISNQRAHTMGWAEGELEFLMVIGAVMNPPLSAMEAYNLIREYEREHTREQSKVQG